MLNLPQNEVNVTAQKLYLLSIQRVLLQKVLRSTVTLQNAQSTLAGDLGNIEILSCDVMLSYYLEGQWVVLVSLVAFFHVVNGPIVGLSLDALCIILILLKLNYSEGYVGHRVVKVEA